MSSPVQQQNLFKKILGRSHNIKTIRFGSSIIQKMNQPTIKSASLYIRPKGITVLKSPHNRRWVNLWIWAIRLWVPWRFPVVPLSIPTNKTLGFFFPGICLTMHQSARIHPYSNVIETPPGQRIPEINPKWDGTGCILRGGPKFRVINGGPINSTEIGVN